jgi:hypothetical protein
MEMREIDAASPGGVYLCQVSQHVSCGACCGLYNTSAADRDALSFMLAFRTRRFSDIPREIDAILGFAEEVQAREPRNRPYPGFHHCPYIGMVGRDKSRVGCLLHPLADGNGGVDYRGLSYYGGMACRDYFCPACKSLKPVYKRILRGAADDWHGYGLIITETALVEAFFHEIENRLGRPLATGDILGHGEREALIRRLIGIRSSWPYRGVPGKLCNYFFEDRKYPKPTVDYAQPGVPHPEPAAVTGHRYHILFQELESAFASEQAMAAAAGIFDDLFGRLVRMIQTPRRKDLRGG